MIGCVRTTGAGGRGLTSVFPAAISDGAAPVLSPATSSTGERSVRKGFFFFFSSSFITLQTSNMQ